MHTLNTNKVKIVKQNLIRSDAAGGGKIQSLRNWYDHLVTEGRNYGYYVNGSKSWLIVKSETIAKEAESIFENSVNITIEGKRHLGAVIGSQNYKDKFCNEKVESWIKELGCLDKIAKTQPQAAYIAFSRGYRSKFTYFLRTIEGFEDYVQPIDDFLNDSFLPTLFGRDTPFPEHFKQLFTLPTCDGGLAIPSLSNEAHQQFTGSILITKPHTEAIIEQQMSLNSKDFKKLKLQHVKEKTAKHKERVTHVDLMQPPEITAHIQQARDKGASAWLNAIPIEQQRLDLSKEEFRDALCLRYNLPLKKVCQVSAHVQSLLTFLMHYHVKKVDL